MDTFTTRPDIRGTFGVVTSTHWIASAAGMRMLELGGNAFDAAVACGLTLQVVEPHLNGPAGDLPAIVHIAATGETRVLCAQGVAPAASTIAHFRGLGLDLVPGSGFLSVVVPGAFDGWMLMLRDHGSLDLATVMEPAISYARDGHPMLPRVAATIAGLHDFFVAHWPTSAQTWAPGGTLPKDWALFRNPDLAATYQRLVDDSSDGSSDGGCEAQIDHARKLWREGFVADAIFDYTDGRKVMDVSENAHGAVLARADMAKWRATWEAPLTATYHGWTVAKTQSWSQGPVLLQTLKLLEGIDLAAMDPLGAEFVHTVVEAMKLAYADREAYYGDPAFSDIPMDHLLSDAYAAERRGLIGKKASLEQRPGRVDGFAHLADAAIARAARDFTAASGVSAGEPTMSHLTERRGDTVHIDVIDRWGNMVAATPSGGWLQSNPVIPGLGFSLGSRAQMFWLEEGLPTSLIPGARPRTTLTPTMAEKDGQRIAFGTPGGTNRTSGN
ncbi:gamma-glutamyltranspeptidase / glutathione hydrolase [Pseudorhodobacter antarcticus]|uniref:Gamma-glutamyltranspeptidase / glutathione hydrolase n=1 Tax=Pseudorhodobacter antarcticus TaxID=1077947 RepID=A0A1H8K966_9RHOB|nr:gamma-glutamyltranspeptidase / glutathione hydrolase [Pseudorhodobacter antarcticus]